MNSVLETQYNVLFTEGNLNNHLGVPFTLLRLNEKHEIAIIEMGANGPNNISELCEVAAPNFGIITNIGKAHIEGFGSYEKLLETKLELYDSVEASGGLVFINLNQKELVTNAPSCDLISYGKSGQIDGEVVKANPFIHISWKGEKEHTIKTNLVGTYNLANALTAITVGTYFDVTEENIVLGLSSYEPENKRSQFIETNDNKIIMDCYNANPTSMMNALENMENLESENKVLILGDMKELGHISDEEHKNIYERAINISSRSYFVGEEFMKLHLSNSFKDVSELITHLESDKISNSLILIKGSRGIALEKVYDAGIL